MNRARTYHCTRMRHCIEQSNGLVPSLLCPSWVDCIIATRGYDFRKGQGCATASSNPTVWYRRCCARLGWTTSSLRADMIFGKDRRLTKDEARKPSPALRSQSPAATGSNPNGPSSGHQTYFAARAITTSVTITNAAICTQKLLAKPPFLKI